MPRYETFMGRSQIIDEVFAPPKVQISVDVRSHGLVNKDTDSSALIKSYQSKYDGGYVPKIYSNGDSSRQILPTGFKHLD